MPYLKKKEIANSVQPPNMEATLSKLRNWEVQKNCKNCRNQDARKSQIKKARKSPIQKMQNAKEMQNLPIQKEEKATW